MADAKRGGLSRRRGVKTRAEQGRGFTLKERGVRASRAEAEGKWRAAPMADAERGCLSAPSKGVKTRAEQGEDFNGKRG